MNGTPALQFLPRCAALVNYGGGDDFRQGEALLSLSLPEASIPSDVISAVGPAVDRILAKRNAGGFDLATEHLPTHWTAEHLVWEAALAVSADPSQGCGWCNIYFHGWLYNDIIESQGAAELSAQQRYPLVGIYHTAGIDSFSGEGPGGVFSDAQGIDVRAAGKGELFPADQHIHKVDAYAGGDRRSTIELYLSEGYDQEMAEAIVVASELECGSFHVGSDAARVSMGPGGGIAWCVAVELPLPGDDRPPRAQATLLFAVPPRSPAADWFRGWLPSPSLGDDEVETARLDLKKALEEKGAQELLGPEVSARLQGALGT